MRHEMMTLSSNWEDIPGFDKIRREYIRLDGDAWLAAHRIREEGEKRGRQDQPGSDETRPDAMYQRIENWVRKRALDCKSDVSKYVEEQLNNLHELGSSWEQENPEIKLDALVTQHCRDLKTQADVSISDIDKQRTECEEAARELRDFRQRHGLSRLAEYPRGQGAQVAHWLWVPVAMIVESFLSANLLGSVSRGGIIEGWMVALVLTLVNVLLGVWVGRSWRLTCYGWGFAKIFGYVQGVVSVTLALVWNDIAGHVRDVYVLAEKTRALEAPDEAFATAWSVMIERPLPWESLASAGLALVGVAVFALTAYKAYTADDPFPGYGARHRKADALHGRYQDDLNDALESLKGMRVKANEAIEEIKNRYEMDQAVWKNALDRLRMIVDDYPANLRQYNNDLAYLLAAYRDANLAARATPPPSFFDIEPAIDESVIRPPEFSYPSPPKWGGIPAKAEAGFAQVEETYARLWQRYEMLNRVVDDYGERVAQ